MKRNLFSHLIALMFLILFLSVWPAVSQGDVRTSENQLSDQDKQKILTQAYDLRIPFIANEGQIAKEVDFYAKTFGGTVYVTRQGEMVYSLTKKDLDQASAKGDKEKKSHNVQVSVLKERLFQAKNISPVGVGKSDTKVNYFIGSNKDKWKTNISSYNSVSYGEVYDHIDFALRAYGNNVEKIFSVNPKGKVEDIQLAVEGASALSVTPEGELEVDTGSGIINFSAPIAFQEIEGKQQEVQVTYALNGKTYGFRVGEYNLKFALIIDPSLVYSNILDGSDNDKGLDIAVDSSGNAYMTGDTYSDDFPTKNPFQDSYGGKNNDAFVTKFTSTGTLSYSTYLGGTSRDSGRGIAVDSTGNAYVTGSTASDDFPTKNPFQDSYYGGGFYTEAFVTKVTSNGALSFSTSLGGTRNDSGRGIAVDSTGNAYVTGFTASDDFPTKNPFQANFGGGWADVFVTKLTSTGTALSYSTYLGTGDGYTSPSSDDYGSGIAVDSSGNAYVTGHTNSTDFPTKNPFQASHGGGDYDAFVAKLNSSGGALSYSTYLGGSSDDIGHRIAVDSSGNAHVTGDTSSDNFPTKNPYEDTYGGFNAAFVTKLASNGTLSYSTYLGGSGGSTNGRGIAVDSSGNAYVTGDTTSDDFPTENPFQSSLDGYIDAYVTKFTSTGTLSYSTYLGGTDNDSGNGIAVDSSGNAYVTGSTWSDDFPQKPDSDTANFLSAFITKFGDTTTTNKAMPWIPLLLLDD
jgi:hypothetical protein